MKQQRFTACVVLIVLFVAGHLSADGAPRPNIVLVVADDLGYGDLACYGSQVNETPHVDSLAATGVRFTDFHSAGPMCSPTRAAMLTGQYQQRLGQLFDAAIDGRRDRNRGLPHAALTVAELMQKHGYATACFGKWHLGYVPPWLPPSHGFDVFRGLGSGDGDFHTHIDRSGNADWWYNNELSPEEGYTTELITKHSVQFIREHQDRPFFLYVPHLGIHFPWQGPNDPPHRRLGVSYHQDKWGIIPDRDNVSPHVKAMVESVDDSVGKIVAALHETQLTGNTLVVFTSDNGGYLTYAPDFRNISSNGPFRGQKTQLYEGGHRVPTIISWPGKIQAAVSSQLGHSADLMPTFAAQAGIAHDEFQTDGVDLSPVLLQSGEVPDRELYWRAHEDRAVRQGPWKLCFTATRTELFNLDNDPSETTNVAAQHPPVVTRLREAWQRWENDVNSSAESHNTKHPE